MAKEDKSLDEATAVGAGLFGASAASAEAASSDAMREGMAQFLERAGAGTPAAQLKGNLFEYIEAAKFNANARLQGSSKFARVTAADGRPRDPVDTEILKGKKVVGEAQFKASDNPSWIAGQQAESKYIDKTRVVPKDMEDEVRQISERKAADLSGKGDSRAENFRDSAKNTTGELRHGNTSSGGTTTKELGFATDHPKLYAAWQEGSHVAREAGTAGLQAAGAAAVVGGAISIIRNAHALSKGDVDGKEAAVNVAADTAKSSVRGGATGAFGSVIRYGASKAGLQTLKKSNVATAVAASLIEAGVTVYAYAKGEIPAEEVAERLGDTGCSTLASIYIGAAAGAILGPAGAIVGSVAGYMVTAQVYQSCIAILRNARLAEEEADRVVALCEQAVKFLDQQREYFETILNEHLNERQEKFDDHFKMIDEALGVDRVDDAILALSGLVGSCGRELKLINFEDFNADMIRSDTPLTL